MSSKSRSQQRYFGAVLNCKRTGKCASPQVAKTASSISAKDAEDFARTKHKGLPERVKKKKGKLKSFHEYMEENNL